LAAERRERTRLPSARPGRDSSGAERQSPRDRTSPLSKRLGDAPCGSATRSLPFGIGILRMEPRPLRSSPRFPPPAHRRSVVRGDRAPGPPVENAPCPGGAVQPYLTQWDIAQLDVRRTWARSRGASPAQRNMALFEARRTWVLVPRHPPSPTNIAYFNRGGARPDRGRSAGGGAEAAGRELRVKFPDLVVEMPDAATDGTKRDHGGAHLIDVLGHHAQPQAAAYEGLRPEPVAPDASVGRSRPPVHRAR